MSKVKDNSLVKKFAKGAAVSVERGGDPENARRNEKARAEGSNRKEEIEAVAARLSEASYSLNR